MENREFGRREWIAGEERAVGGGRGPGGGKDGPPGAERPWLGIYFKCSGSYLRVFRSADGKEYLARCPRCGKTVSFAVGTGGTSQRFFEVSC